MLGVAANSVQRPVVEYEQSSVSSSFFRVLLSSMTNVTDRRELAIFENTSRQNKEHKSPEVQNYFIAKGRRSDF
ncbi:hypothetical protein F9C07_9214 [Aspergillus flavus]|uniref:Uncharacterized protein n=1 Tax=Aspergillus flavus (strain ATCC 200026 / FGSC A1120 / IAM 13836 / NRRL 3357 / JCM 12722 / SRRC 167) TaxID=332952 RepID=A0A7U2QW23_ASPFN|nr:hypothetical protein F9C07_9214 [Aspergillus flavus]